MRLRTQTSYKVALLWTFFVCGLIFLFIYPAIKTGNNKPSVLVWPSWVSRDAKLHIRPNENTAIMTPNILQSPDKVASHKLLVVVCSALKNQEERKAIRMAWAAPDLTPDGVAVVFLVGRASKTEGSRNSSNNISSSSATATSPTVEDTLKSNLQEEQRNFGDLVQEDFVDNYANLSVKSLFLLKMASSPTFPFPFVLKTDDDVFVNLRTLSEEVDKHAASSSSSKQRIPTVLQGNLICGAVPIRDPYNKWYAPHHMFPESVYPNYLSGTAYLMSKTAASALFNAAISTAVSKGKGGGIFHLEDIYVTGILARRAGIRPRDHPGFTYLKQPIKRPCVYAQAFSSHGLKPKEMTLMADRMRSGVTANCKRIPINRLRGYGPGKCKW